MSPASGSTTATTPAITGRVTGDALEASTCAPTQITTTAIDGTRSAAASTLTKPCRPGRSLSTRVRASANVTAVDIPVQPLRSAITEPIPMTNGTRRHHRGCRSTRGSEPSG